MDLVDLVRLRRMPRVMRGSRRRRGLALDGDREIALIDFQFIKAVLFDQLDQLLDQRNVYIRLVQMLATYTQ